MLKKAMVLACLLFMVIAPAYCIGENGEVIIGQQVVLRIRYPAGGMSIEKRAEAVTLRINKYLGVDPFDPSMVRVAKVNKEYCVMIGNDVIITVDEKTAKYNKTTPEKLAEIWATNIRTIIPKAKAMKGG